MSTRPPRNSKEVTREQAKQIAASLGPMLGYLTRLQRRMDTNGFEQDDRLYRLVSNAQDALHSLWVHTHYMSCDGAGVLTGHK